MNNTAPPTPPHTMAHRRHKEIERDRRVGASRLATWPGRKLALAWVVWPVSVALLVAAGALISFHRLGDASEVRSVLRRSNVIAVLAVLVVPPACLTVQWWRMRHRRRQQS